MNDCDYLHDGGESKIEDVRCIQILFSQPICCVLTVGLVFRYVRLPSTLDLNRSRISNTLCTNVPVVCSALIDLSHIRNAKFETTKSFLSVFFKLSMSSQSEMIYQLSMKYFSLSRNEMKK